MQYPYRLLVPDGYKPNLRVHPSCRDEAHPAEKPVRTDEGIALKNPRPDRDDDSPGAAVDHSGTALAGGANSLTLATTASSVASDYINGTLALASGAGSVQERTIPAYNAVTKVATVSPNWNAQYLDLPGTFGNYASTPDSAAVSITGKIDIRVKAAANDWAAGVVQEFVDKSTTDSSQFSYLLRLNQDATLTLYWSQDGTNLLSASSTVAISTGDGDAVWIRGTLDTDNGAAGRDIKFYTSADGVVWTQLGATVTQAGATSIFDGTATLKVGQRAAGGPFAGKIFYAEVRNGIDGPVVAKFDPLNDGGKIGDTSFTSSTGEVWTINQSGSPAAELDGPPDATTEYSVTVPDTLAEAMGFTNSFGGAT
jgi:hypothetical protein